MKQVIRLTESDVHMIVRTVIQEIVSELGPRYTSRLPEVGFRRIKKGEPHDDVRKHAEKNGMSKIEYTKGIIDQMDKNPNDTAKIVSRDWHKSKEQ